MTDSKFQLRSVVTVEVTAEDAYILHGGLGATVYVWLLPPGAADAVCVADGVVTLVRDLSAVEEATDGVEDWILVLPELEPLIVKAIRSAPHRSPQTVNNQKGPVKKILAGPDHFG